jgi:hypothetical protein
MTDPIDVTERLVTERLAELARGLDRAFETAVQSDADKREQNSPRPLAWSPAFWQEQ